jgi:hypothetical protein
VISLSRFSLWRIEGDGVAIKKKKRVRGESNISRRRERENHFMLCSHYHPIRLCSDEMYAFRASFFPFFYWTYLPSVRRIIYRVERVYIHVHSFFMITTICSHLRQKNSLFVFFSSSFLFACSFNCRYIFPETTLPRRQIPEYRLCVC